MRVPSLLLGLALTVVSVSAVQARLSLTDKLSTYRRATIDERTDFAARIAKSFASLVPGMDQRYVLNCLEETANIGDPREIELDAAVKLCVTSYRAPGERPED